MSFLTTSTNPLFRGRETALVGRRTRLQPKYLAVMWAILAERQISEEIFKWKWNNSHLSPSSLGTGLVHRLPAFFLHIYSHWWNPYNDVFKFNENNPVKFDTWGGILKNMFDAERSPFHASLFAQLVTKAAQFFSISSKVNVAPFLLWLFAFFRMGHCFCRRFFLCGLLWWGHRGLLYLRRHHRQRTGDEGGADGHEQGRWASWCNLRLPFSTESRGVTERFG